MSAFGDLGYPADFPFFKYVNPDAPKGGVFSEIGTSREFNGSFLTFNTLNAYILKGEGAFGHGITFATLMARSGDEPDAMYGLAAPQCAHFRRWADLSLHVRPKRNSTTARRSPAHDVVWSLATLKEKGHPIITQLLRDFKGVEANDDRTVSVLFAEKRGRDVPLFVASLPIFSRAYYANKPFDQSTLDIPLGSGAYKVGRFERRAFHRI